MFLSAIESGGLLEMNCQLTDLPIDFKTGSRSIWLPQSQTRFSVLANFFFDNEILYKERVNQTTLDNEIKIKVVILKRDGGALQCQLQTWRLQHLSPMFSSMVMIHLNKSVGARFQDVFPVDSIVLSW